MIRAIFFDLDDTLLSNKMSSFLPAYLQKLGEHMAHLASPERLIEQLMLGTRSMLENRDPARTLREAFAERFYPALGWSEEPMRPHFEAFYTEVFPTLVELTGRRAEAPGLIQAARERDLQVAVATNPLFPRMAIEERLRWAGLPPDEGAFAEVSSYECFHFAKPHPEYFVELAGRMGLRPSQAAMVGNELQNDIQPAQSLGMPTFRVEDDSEAAPADGSLDGAAEWVRGVKESHDPTALSTSGGILALLRGYLAASLGLTQAVGADWWGRRPEPDEWAVVEILCHLRDVEREINFPRIRAILDQHEPFLSAADPDSWAEERGYLACVGTEVRSEWLEARSQTLKLLEAIEPEDWLRPARHSLLGPTDLAEILSVAAEHDRLHLEQLRKTIPAEARLEACA